MFTEEDYKEYLEAIISLESGMVFFSKGLLEKIRDEEVGSKVEEVLKDETKHYAMGRGLYRSFFKDSPHQDDEAVYEFSKGKAKLTGRDQRTVEGYLLVQGSDSIGIECREPLELHGGYEVEIEAKDGKTIKGKKGEVSWSYALTPTLHLVNIKLS